MKKTALALAATFALPLAAMADSKLCDANLQKLDDLVKTVDQSATGAKVDAIHEHVAQARKARAAGDYESCVTHAKQALDLLQKPANR